MKIRNAKHPDASQILAIYEPFIAETAVTFENDVPSVDEFSERIKLYQQSFPWLVAADTDGKIAGYAYASKYRERVSYQWVSEVSIYIKPGHKRAGIATKLYKALFEILKLQGIYKVYAVISIPNPASISFHEKFGFSWFATYKNVGNKFGKWCDVGWWELALKGSCENPEPPIPYPNIDPEIVKSIFEKYS